MQAYFDTILSCNMSFGRRCANRVIHRNRKYFMMPCGSMPETNLRIRTRQIQWSARIGIEISAVIII